MVHTEWTSPSFHLMGDSFVDLLCYLEDGWPELGGDARLIHPIQTFAGGSATNTATHLTSLLQRTQDTTARVTLQTVYHPHDEYGVLLQEHAHIHGYRLINNRMVDDDPSATGHCLCIVSRGERTFMTHLGCVEHFSAKNIQIDVILEEEHPAHVHVAGYFNIVGFWNGRLYHQLQQIKDQRPHTTISLVTQHDYTNTWDGGLSQVVPLLDVLFLNEMEASKIVTGAKLNESQSSNITTQWAEHFQAWSTHTCVVITRGSQGAVALRNGQVIACVEKAISVQVVDPTGAGDAFAAGFLYGVHQYLGQDTHKKDGNREWSSECIQEGLLWGCALGTAGVTVRGASVPIPASLVTDLLEQQRNLAHL
jgi:ribokinase